MYVRRPLRAAGWGTRRPGGMLFKRQAVRAILPSLPPPRPPRPAPPVWRSRRGEPWGSSMHLGLSGSQQSMEVTCPTSRSARRSQESVSAPAAVPSALWRAHRPTTFLQSPAASPPGGAAGCAVCR